MFTRRQIKAIRAENRAHPVTLREMPQEEWSDAIRTMNRLVFSKMVRAWRSRSFVVMLFAEPSGYSRLSVMRCDFVGAGDRAVGGITWDEMQQQKREAGFGQAWAVECFPPDADVVNIQNMRHMFLLPEPPAFGWRSAVTIPAAVPNVTGNLVDSSSSTGDNSAIAKLSPVLERAGSCTPATPCCDRRGEYNGFGSDGPVSFFCTREGGCMCHD